MYNNVYMVLIVNISIIRFDIYKIILQIYFICKIFYMCKIYEILYTYYMYSKSCMHIMVYMYNIHIIYFNTYKIIE